MKRTSFAVLALCCLPLLGTAARGQTEADLYQLPPEQIVQPSPPPGSAVVYLVNYSQGRALFIIAPHGPHSFVGARPKDETIACDVASSNRFGQETISPGSWCRIYVNTNHRQLWLWAETYYAHAQCSQSGCWKSATPYYTTQVQLKGLAEGGLYEYDACGAIGVNGATCGWREITEQGKVY
jgi:hypothetical protein